VKAPEAITVALMLSVVFIMVTIGFVLVLRSNLFPTAEKCPSCKERALKRAHRIRLNPVDGTRGRETMEYWRCAKCRSAYRRPRGVRLEPLTEGEWLNEVGSRF
jgi:predicted RNA-binding Zn-ribbon protein involved in translation (DUF1610 family)